MKYYICPLLWNCQSNDWPWTILFRFNIFKHGNPSPYKLCLWTNWHCLCWFYTHIYKQLMFTCKFQSLFAVWLLYITFFCSTVRNHMSSLSFDIELSIPICIIHIDFHSLLKVCYLSWLCKMLKSSCVSLISSSLESRIP